MEELISARILSSAQIKEHLEFLIRYQGKRKNMEDAVEDWKSDIRFLNSRYRF